jgi:hypothetical protein
MVTSVANVAGGIASLLLSAMVLCFNVPHMIGSEMWTRPAPTIAVYMRRNGSSRTGFHATFSLDHVGKTNKQLTLRLEFSGTGVRSEDEGL